MMSIDTLLRNRFVRLHGEGESHQADLYRCVTCGRLITWKMIRAGDVKCCQGRLCKTSPTLWEAFRLIAFPWTV